MMSEPRLQTGRRWELLCGGKRNGEEIYGSSNWIGAATATTQTRDSSRDVNPLTAPKKRNLIRTAVWSLTTLVLAACVTNPYYDPAKPHHTRDGFRNRYPHAEKGSFWKWKMEQWREGKPEEMPAGGWGFTVLRPDVGFLKSNRSTDTLTWIGHSSFLLQLDGVNILTDPHLTKRASPVWRARIRTMALISHQTVPSFGPRAVAK